MVEPVERLEVALAALGDDAPVFWVLCEGERRDLGRGATRLTAAALAVTVSATETSHAPSSSHSELPARALNGAA